MAGDNAYSLQILINVSQYWYIYSPNFHANIFLLSVDPDRIADDGTYSGIITKGCLGGGRINLKVYTQGQPGVTKLNLNPRSSYVSDGNISNLAQKKKYLTKQ